MSSVASKPIPAGRTPRHSRDAASGKFESQVWQVRTASDLENIMPEVKEAIRDAQHEQRSLTFTLRVELEQSSRTDLVSVSADIIAERALIGLLLYDNTGFQQAVEVDATFFRDDLNARIFAEMMRCLAAGGIAEPITLMERLKGDPAFEAAGGLRYLADLILLAPPISDAGALVRILRELNAHSDTKSPSVPMEPSSELATALSKAEARGAARATDILALPDMLGADAFAKLIGVTREAVRQKLKRREVLGLQGAKRGVRYPAWQVGRDGGLLPGLPQLFATLGESPWTVYRFLTQPNPAFEGRPPFEALHNGRQTAVAAVAEAQGQGDFG